MKKWSYFDKTPEDSLLPLAGLFDPFIFTILKPENHIQSQGKICFLIISNTNLYQKLENTNLNSFLE